MKDHINPPQLYCFVEKRPYIRRTQTQKAIIGKKNKMKYPIC